MFASGKTAAVASAANYIEDVFSTYLYTGTSASQTITNGINLSTYGGLVVIKGRNTPTGSSAYGGAANQFTWQDTVRGITQTICSNRTDAQLAAGGFASNSSISTSGFILDYNGYNDYNRSPNTYASWTFRKQPKFFDVVTWTGDNTNNRAINHSLGGTVGCLIVKKTSGTGDWPVWHRSLPAYGANPQSKSTLYLNATLGGDADVYFGSTAPTSTAFYVDVAANASGSTYVAYLFAHDAGGFGLTGTDNVISCGSFTTDGSGNATVSLGYEPQWVLYKRTSSAGSWLIIDNMRGDSANATNNANYLLANTSDAEGTATWLYPTATGFTGNANSIASTDFIYIAIRRGPMKVPTSGTSVFSPQVQTPTGSTGYVMASSSGFPIDWLPTKQKGTVVDWYQTSRLTNNYMSPNTTAAEVAYTYGFDLMQGVSAQWTANSTVSYAFRRAPSFFDEVCYTGTEVSGQTFNHNLGAVPEMMIVKARSGTTDWTVYHSALGASARIYLNATNAANTGTAAPWNSTAPTSTVFSLGNAGATNLSGTTFVNYLFATCAGVSKVGSYTGTGTTKQIDCGFTGGARFVLIKRTDSTGDWYVWDTARGIVSGNDPYLLLNSTAAEVTNTDYVDTYSAGFEISSTAPAAINANGGTFIFLAIA